MKKTTDTKKRFKIYGTKLWEIKNQNFEETLWFSHFIQKFSGECGLEKTSVRTSQKRNWIKGGIEIKETFYFKVIDKHKLLLGKIKYGF